MFERKFYPNLFAVLGLLVASPVLLAQKAAPCEGSALCASENDGGYFVGLTGYYIRPSETGIGLATDSWQYNGSSGAITTLSKPFTPDHRWGGGAKLGYDFDCSANSVEIDYLHFDSRTPGFNDQSDDPISFGSVFFPNVFFDLPLAGFVSDAHLKYQLDQITILGKRSYQENLGRFKLIPSLGVRWAELKHKLVFVDAEVTSSFQGLGPVFGLDGSWGFYDCLNLIGKVDYSPIVGKIRSNSYLTRALGESQFISPKVDRIVHNMNAKLAVDWHYTFCNKMESVLELGYQASQYINATDMIRGNYQDGGVPEAQRLAGIETNSFTFHGPYLEFTWHF